LGKFLVFSFSFAYPFDDQLTRQPVEQAGGQADADDERGDQVICNLCTGVQLGGRDLVMLVVFLVFHTGSLNREMGCVVIANILNGEP
jgi:hypothetical protein